MSGLYSYGSTGAIQYFTVSTNGTYDISGYGGRGGNGPVTVGGYGAEESGEFTLTAGEKLKLVIGGRGGDGSGSYAAGGGGGGTFVLANTGPSGSYQLLLAAGGGGGGTGGGTGGYNGYKGQVTVDRTYTGAGNGNGGGAGTGSAAAFSGGGGAGFKGPGGSSGGAYAGQGGSNGPTYAGGGAGRPSVIMGSTIQPGGGGFGGGGGGGGGYRVSNGAKYNGYGGGGGGYTGGGSIFGGGFGGTSFISPSGRLITGSTVAGQNGGAGKVNIQFVNGTVCFCSGTSIRTDRGDVAVEDLAVGDRVATRGGEHRPIRWIGHTDLDCRRHPRPREAMPVRIQGGAFGPRLPERDLWVSPGHAICLDILGEVLVPASSLVNGSTVAQVEVDAVTYWHVELDRHDVLFANGMPVESYMDVGNRAFFESGEGHVDPDRTISSSSDYILPLHQDGVLVEAIRQQIGLRSLALGWSLDTDPLADLHLVVDGDRIEAEVDGLRARFVVPANAEHVRLVSDTFVPRDLGIDVYGDQRRLGTCVRALSLDDGFSTPLTIMSDDARLVEGFHDAESEHRWTDGRARLPKALWEGCRGSFFLRVDLAGPTEPRWVAPAGAATTAVPIVAPTSTGLRLVHNAA